MQHVPSLLSLLILFLFQTQQRHQQVWASSLSSSSCSVEPFDRGYNDIDNIPYNNATMRSEAQCCSQCDSMDTCAAWTFVHPPGPRTGCHIKFPTPKASPVLPPCAPYCSSGHKPYPQGAFEVGYDRPGSDFASFDNTDGPGACAQACEMTNSCKAWTYVAPNATVRSGCFLKNNVPGKTKLSACGKYCTSGLASGVQPASPCGGPHAVGIDLRGGDYKTVVTDGPDGCCAACQADAGNCVAWTYVEAEPYIGCHLKSTLPVPINGSCDRCTSSGQPKRCASCQPIGDCSLPLQKPVEGAVVVEDDDEDEEDDSNKNYSNNKKNNNNNHNRNNHNNEQTCGAWIIWRPLRETNEFIHQAFAYDPAYNVSIPPSFRNNSGYYSCGYTPWNLDQCRSCGVSTVNNNDSNYNNRAKMPFHRTTSRANQDPSLSSSNPYCLGVVCLDNPAGYKVVLSSDGLSWDPYERGYTCWFLDPSKYQFMDCLALRQAEISVQKDWNYCANPAAAQYSLLTHNCRHYVVAVMQQYCSSMPGKGRPECSCM